ncbi:unnamed protein product [Haemonchus placei]|uniref:PHD domain-containing protein n=1 Tax=Haemonchus placei TaxID=6290 RepID=A0A158QNA0_HAEPC|nr:unnamed protein product [Haemonchus placei]
MPRKRRGKRHVYHYDEENGLLEEIVKVTSPPGKPKAIKRYEKPSAASVAADWNSVNRTYCVVCRLYPAVVAENPVPGSKFIYIDELSKKLFAKMTTEEEYRQQELERIFSKRKITSITEFYVALSSSLTNCNARQACAKKLAVEMDCSDVALKITNGHSFEKVTELSRWVPHELTEESRRRRGGRFDVPPSIRIDGLAPYGLMPYKGLAQPRQIIIDEPCVICEGIGEESPKIQCDFCKYVYHVDCLQFPLCSPPSEAWMCPNHVEPIVDLKLLNSISFTERRRIWLRYARQPVNEMEIRKNFVEKVVSSHKGLSDCFLKDEISLKKSNSEYLKKEAESDGEQMRRFPKCFDGSVIVPETRRTRRSSNTVSNRLEVSGLAEVPRTVSEAFSSTPSQASKKPNYSSPFCAAILPRLDNRMSCGSQLYSHDRVYSIMLPYRTDEQQGSHFVHVDFGLDEGNCSLDCRSFSTDEDLCHSPIVIPNRTENAAPTPLMADTPSSPLSLDPCCQEVMKKRNESNHQIPSIDITPTIKMLDAGRGSLLRALLDGTDGVSHVEPAIEKQRFIMQRTRQPKKFAVKSKT